MANAPGVGNDSVFSFLFSHSLFFPPYCASLLFWHSPSIHQNSSLTARDSIAYRYSLLLFLLPCSSSAVSGSSRHLSRCACALVRGVPLGLYFFSHPFSFPHISLFISSPPGTLTGSIHRLFSGLLPWRTLLAVQLYSLLVVRHAIRKLAGHMQASKTKYNLPTAGIRVAENRSGRLL